MLQIAIIFFDVVLVIASIFVARLSILRGHANVRPPADGIDTMAATILLIVGMLLLAISLRIKRRGSGARARHGEPPGSTPH